MSEWPAGASLTCRLCGKQYEAPNHTCTTVNPLSMDTEVDFRQISSLQCNCTWSACHAFNLWTMTANFRLVIRLTRIFGYHVQHVPRTPHVRLRSLPLKWLQSLFEAVLPLVGVENMAASTQLAGIFPQHSPAYLTAVLIQHNYDVDCAIGAVLASAQGEQAPLKVCSSLASKRTFLCNHAAEMNFDFPTDVVMECTSHLVAP